MWRFFFLAFCITVCHSTYGEATGDGLIADTNRYVEVGKPLPNLVLKNINGNSDSIISTDDFKGKWLLLDLWNRHCSACVGGFPKMEKIRKDFAKDVDVVLVGYLDSDSKIVSLYERLRKQYGYNFTTAFDSTLFERLDLFSAPVIILRDPEGVVRAVTIDIDSSKLSRFVKNQPIDMPKARRTHQEFEYTFDDSKPFLIAGNGGVDSSYLFRSLLSLYKFDQRNYRTDFASFLNKGTFSIIGARPSELFNLAYWGKSGWSMGDSLYGKVSSSPLVSLPGQRFVALNDYYEKDYLVNYSLTVPYDFRTRNKFESILRNDLDNYYGFQISFDIVSVKCYRLVVINSDKVKKQVTRINKSSFDGYGNGPILLKSIKVPDLISLIASRNNPALIFLDNSGVDFPIDIYLDGLLSDIESMQRSLKKVGFDLIEEDVPVRCLILTPRSIL